MKYKVKELREQKNMTQVELSEKSGVSRTIISGLESGKRKVTTTKTLCDIAEALGEEVDAIFFKDDV